jgi:conjugal transfer pilus assembly protein TraF
MISSIRMLVGARSAAMGRLLSGMFLAFLLACVGGGFGQVRAQEAAPQVYQQADKQGGQQGDQQGDRFYCEERQLGQHFYCVRPQKKDTAVTASPSVPETATQRLKQITEKLNELKAAAILEPTSENVVSYIKYQREQLDRASDFSDTWRRAVWQDSDLDYTLERPVNTLGKRLYQENRTALVSNTMASLGDRYGVFYFYSSSCQACEIFSPILKSVADKYALTVMPISMDGGPNTVFPNYLVDTGQYKAMGLEGQNVPALVLFDTVTKRPMPIGYGVFSGEEIMERIYTLTQTEIGSNY